jgi:hypothetical protein
MFGAGKLSANPVTYYWFSDTALYNDSGSGSFAFDIENPLGKYFAAKVNGSTASAEWDNFIQQAARNRIFITADAAVEPLSADNVPESKLPLLFSGLIFAGIFAMRRLTSR